jgi:hypothetical protein
VSNVVAVAHVGQLAPGQVGSEHLAHRHVVGHALAGVEVIGQPVDHRNRRVGRQIENILVGKGAGHDEVDEARQHVGGVGDRLPAAELDVAARQEEGVSTELGHADLEAHPGAGRRLLEDHAEALALERLGEPLGLGLHLIRQREDLVRLRTAQVMNRNQVAFGHRLPPFR